jgi:hypothetical protein
LGLKQISRAGLAVNPTFLRSRVPISFACTLASADQSLAVHKDKPPGIFDLGDRSMRYAAGFCFVVGFVLSVIIRVGVGLARGHFSQVAPWSGS